MRRKITWIAGIIVVIGFCITGWNGYQHWFSTQSVHATDDPADHEHDHKITQQPDQNEQANHQKQASSPDVSTLDKDHEKGTDVAELQIPKFDLSYDVFWGTDEDSLKEGVGMYVSKWTTVPNPDTGHTVLSGHRDTVFTKLKDLEDGDTLKVQYDNKTFNYRIHKIWTTDPDDRSIIVKKDQPTLTLTTCYPFDFIGSAPERYIVQAELQDEE